MELGIYLDTVIGGSIFVQLDRKVVQMGWGHIEY